MGVPTVYIVGAERLPLVPEYLNLGSVVVIAPDRETLRRWRWEQEEPTMDPDRGGSEQSGGSVVDLAGRRIVSDGIALPLSELEFQVLTALLSAPGQAFSFGELRRSGWGELPDLPIDKYSVRALIQRLRAKLRTANADFSIEAVRGFGFRLEFLPAAGSEPRALVAGARPD